MYLSRIEQNLAEALALTLIGQGEPFGVDLTGLDDFFMGGRVPDAVLEFEALLKQFVEDLSNCQLTLRIPDPELFKIVVLGPMKAVAVCPYDTPEIKITEEMPNVRIAAYGPYAAGNSVMWNPAD